jgi:alkaline phosphatase D
MNLPRRTILKMLPLSVLPASQAAEAQAPFLGQGTICGEVTQSTAFLQTRLTSATELDANGDLPGANGVACFEWSTKADFSDAQRTPFQAASDASDFILRAELTTLKPNTTCYYRPIFGSNEASAKPGPDCSFRTLPSGETDTPVKFIVGSCMNYNKFMLGKEGKASGPETATAEDKRLGFPSFETMLKQRPDFFIGTGDIVYYDHPLRVAKTVPQLRQCWHEQFRFPRMIEFFRRVPTYWSKDDHDHRSEQAHLPHAPRRQEPANLAHGRPRLSLAQ